MPSRPGVSKPMANQRIQLILRNAGIGSRRKTEQMILEGRVTLNGRVVSHPAETADPETDHIKVDGKLLKPAQTRLSYYVFNKPRHVVSTMSDPRDRPCVGDFVKAMKIHLFSVGRLDFDAEGLMILTNDGDFAQAMSHPSAQIPRTYLVKVGGNPPPEVLTKIKPGMSIGEGERIGRITVAVTKRQKTSTWLRVVIHEGKRNEIKRIFDRIRHPVRKLRRVAFGPIALGKLPVGTWREFTPVELSHVHEIKSHSSVASSKH